MLSSVNYLIRILRFHFYKLIQILQNELIIKNQNRNCYKPGCFYDLEMILQVHLILTRAKFFIFTSTNLLRIFSSKERMMVEVD